MKRMKQGQQKTFLLLYLTQFSSSRKIFLQTILHVFVTEVLAGFLEHESTS